MIDRRRGHFIQGQEPRALDLKPPCCVPCVQCVLSAHACVCGCPWGGRTAKMTFFTMRIADALVCKGPWKKEVHCKFFFPPIRVQICENTSNGIKGLSLWHVWLICGKRGMRIKRIIVIIESIITCNWNSIPLKCWYKCWLLLFTTTTITTVGMETPVDYGIGEGLLPW